MLIISVRPSDEKCSKAHNIHLSLSGQSQVSLQSVSGQSQASLKSLSAYFVIPSEPKILRLVFLKEKCLPSPRDKYDCPYTVFLDDR